MKYSFLLLLVFAFSSVFAQSDVVGEALNDTVAVKQDLAKNAEYFSKGLEAKYNENDPVAIYNFEQALRFYTEDDASMYELSMLYQKNGRNTESLSMIKAASELNPENKWYQLQLAQAYLYNSDYQSFMDIYDNLLKEDPENLDYLENYIDVLLRIGDYDKVIEKLDVVESQLGKNEYIFFQKIQIYDEQGNTDKALKEMENLVEFMPENTRYRAMLAEAYRKVKRDKDAYKQYLKIKELDPNDKYINISLMDYYQNMGELDKAFDEFVAAIRNKNLDYETKAQVYDFWFEKQSNKETVNEDAEALGKAFMETHPDKSLGYYIMGTVHYNKKEYVKARDYYLQALEHDKNNFVTLYQLALCYIELHDYQHVIEATDKAISLYPEQPLFYMLNGISYLDLKDYETSVKVLEKGRKLSANKELTVSFDTYIGDIYNQLGNKQKSYDAYERVLKADPNNIYVMNNYAYYLSLDGQELEKALQMSGKTIKAEPKNATYLDTYAWVLYKMERYQEAKKFMDKVFKYDKKPNGTNYEHMGDILYRLGDVKGAVKNWKKAKKLGDVSEFIDKKIKEEKLYE